MIASVKGQYLDVPDYRLPGCLGILKALLDTGIRLDLLLAGINQYESIGKIARCLTSIRD
jgi:hypothetical protein